MSAEDRQQVDAIGKLETRGIDHIPEKERHASPWNIFWIFVGGDLAFSLIIFGWLPITFGMSFWDAFWAVLVGNAVGAFVLSPMGLFGQRTGTNGAVSSGAHFGVVGRLIGSLLALFSALGFIALAVWTGGQAVAGAIGVLGGLEVSDTLLAISYGVIVLVVVVISVLGHANLVAAQKFMVPTMGILLLIGVFVLAPQFSPAATEGREYLLGGYWPTWILSALIVASVPISYGPFVSDWSRYIPRRYSHKSMLLATSGGAFIGMSMAGLFGAYTASMFLDPTTDYVLGLTAISPTW